MKKNEINIQEKGFPAHLNSYDNKNVNKEKIVQI